MEETEESKTHLRNLLSPFAYNEVEQGSTSDPGHRRINPGIHYRARIASSCEWGWEYNTSIIRMIAVDGVFDDPEASNDKGGVGVCAEAFQFQAGMFITCSVELKGSRSVGTVVLGLNIANREGAIVIFDPVRGKPAKFILVPAPVRSVTVISHNEKEGDNRPYFNEAMMAMVGILGVGLEGGDALILDLGLDDSFLSSVRSQRTQQQWISCPNVMAESPHRLEFVAPHQLNIATKRHHAVQQKQLITLLISSSRTRENGRDVDFCYNSESGEQIQMIPQNEVNLCAIDYAPALGALILGFNFGGFQLWRVDNLTLLYSCPSLEHSLEITGFSVAMPVDDPKNFVYLWVMYGREGVEFGSSHVSLYSFGFLSTHTLDNFGLVYDDFDRKCCSNRLTIQLEDVFGHEDDDIEEEDENAKFFVRPLKMWTDSVRRLTFFCWEVNRNGVYYVGIFDMDSWYSNRALDSIRCNPETSLCPYWVAIPVAHSDTENCIIWDAVIPAQSLERWDGAYAKHDMHTYPASLSFQGISLTNHGVITWQHWGVQEKFIRKIDEDGPNLMIHPRSLCNLLQSHGICPAYPLEFDSTVSSEVQDRFFILTALLDNGRRATLTQLAQAWFDGSYANVGCSINLLMEWITCLTCCINANAKEHWKILFDSRNYALPRESTTFLQYSYYVWTNLRFFLNTLMRPEQVRHSYTGTYVDDLDYALEKMISYSTAILLLQTADVLPVSDEFDVLELLTASHRVRRAHVTQALADCNLLDATNRSIRPMMIDHLLAHFPEDYIRSQWNIEGDQELYPPRSFAYILGMLMWPHEEPMEVYRVVRYFLLDVQDVLTSTGRGLLRMDLYQVAPLSKADYEDVHVLWRFDHGWVKEPVMLLNGRKARLTENDKLPWIPSIIVSTALGLHSEVKSVLSQACPSSLIKLNFKLQMADPKSFATLCDNINLQKLGSGEGVLNSFFEVLEESGYVQRFIQEKFTNSSVWMQEGLINNLKKQPQSFDRDMQLLYVYCMMGNVIQLEEQKDSILRTYNLETLGKDQFKEWTRLSEATSIIIQEAKFDSPLQFVFNDQKIPFNDHIPPRKILKIKARKVNNSSNNKMGLPKLPPQLQRLRAQEKQPGPLSPLRKYAAKIASFIETPHQSRNSLSKQSSRLRMSISHSSMSRFLDDEEAVGEIDNTQADNKNETSCLKLLELLELPSIDHRNPSRPSTPARDDQFKALETPHSIMRIRGKSPRKHLPVSFVNLTPPRVATIPEENEVVMENSPNCNISADLTFDTGKDSFAELPTPQSTRGRSKTPEAFSTPSDTPNSECTKSRSKTPEVVLTFGDTSILESTSARSKTPDEVLTLGDSAVSDSARARSRTPEAVSTQDETPMPHYMKGRSKTPEAVSTQDDTSILHYMKGRSKTPEAESTVGDTITPHYTRARSKTPTALTAVSTPSDISISESTRARTKTPEAVSSPEDASPNFMGARSKTPEVLSTPIDTPTIPEEQEVLLENPANNNISTDLTFDIGVESFAELPSPASPQSTRGRSKTPEAFSTPSDTPISECTKPRSKTPAASTPDDQPVPHSTRARSKTPEAASTVCDPPTSHPTRARSKTPKAVSTSGDTQISELRVTSRTPDDVLTLGDSSVSNSMRARSKTPEAASTVGDIITPHSARARRKTPKAVSIPSDIPESTRARSKTPEAVSTLIDTPTISEEHEALMEIPSDNISTDLTFDIGIDSFAELPSPASPQSTRGRSKTPEAFSTPSDTPISDCTRTRRRTSAASTPDDKPVPHSTRARSKTPAASTPDDKPVPHSTRARSKTTAASTPDDKPMPHSTRARSKTPEAASTVGDPPTSHSTRARSKTPKPVSTASDIPISESARPVASSTRSKTPTDWSTVEESSKTTRSRSTRSRSKSKSSPEPPPPTRALRTRKNRVFDFAPELSTVAEDSERSVMDATLLDTTITASGSKQTRRRAKKSKLDTTEYEADEESLEILEKPPKRNRRSCSTAPQESDEIESDSSSVRTTRSTTRRKTPTVSKKRKSLSQ